MKHYVLAISGGVDSVVLLDMLAHSPGLQLVVAHFDHGIREDSAKDAAFVKDLAQTYGLPYETERAELSADASEEKARTARYAFLHKVAAKYGAYIVTAHHADDVLETIIINITRGTGWRGLASLRTTADIVRPLLKHRKQELIDYAQLHNLRWREDPSNATTAYLRNRIRHNVVPRLGQQTEDRLLMLYQRQVVLREEIEHTTSAMLESMRQSEGAYARHEFIMLEPPVASELLYALIQARTGRGLTRERCRAALLAIKVARTGSVFQVGDGVVLRFEKRVFFVQLEVK